MASLVIGASRGLGLALTGHLLRRGPGLVLAARRPSGAGALEELQREYPDSLRVLELDVTDPSSVSCAAEQAAVILAQRQLKGLELLCHTVGLLQDKDHGVIPENHLQKVDAKAMAYSFAVNAIGPVLVLKHFAPLLKSGAAGDGDRRSLAKAIFYSARVGSIGDNATGGWYSYRSSKAALNQILRSASVELRRSAVCCVALHPGTVDTDLTRAFARARAKYKVQDVNEAAEKHLALIDSWSMADSGHFFDWQGKEVPW